MRCFSSAFLVALWALVGHATAQGTAAGDKAALLAFKGSEPANERSADMLSWQAETEPCGPGSSGSYTSGWTA